MSICIVGSGIIGLSTALAIQDKEPRAKVTLVAESFSPDVTSDVAAGYWRPYLLSDPRTDVLRRWGELTFQHIERLAYREPDTGALWQSGYEMRQDSVKEDFFWKDTVRNYRNISERELHNMGFSQFKSAIFYTTLALEGSIYLPRMLEQFKRNGGMLQHRRLENLDGIGGNYDAIGNCSGLGARHLINDTSVYPIRGQTIRVQAPHIKHFYVFGDDHYVLQNGTSIVLGGTHQDHDWDTSVRPADFDHIWNGNTKFLPALKTAKIIKQVTGLRPGRPTIRLEAESRAVCGKTKTVVH
uniref:FAD dependent oxidoreductase domain-containing protein n=1 Tax=Plectus sambesii TaxID=2011161 RepID=A0A914V6U7_9BILA